MRTLILQVRTDWNLNEGHIFWGSERFIVILVFGGLSETMPLKFIRTDDARAKERNKLCLKMNSHLVHVERL